MKVALEGIRFVGALTLPFVPVGGRRFVGALTFSGLAGGRGHRAHPPLAPLIQGIDEAMPSNATFAAGLLIAVFMRAAAVVLAADVAG